MTVGEFRHMLSEEPSVINARLQRLRQAELIETHFDRRRLMISLAPRAVPIVSRLLGDFYDDISWDPDITDDLNRMQSKRVIKSLEEMYHFSEA